MNVPWQYLDKRAATISAIKDRESMLSIASHALGEIQMQKDRMMSNSHPLVTIPPKVSSNHRAVESKLAAVIDSIDVLRVRHKHAMEFCEWFTPAWERLTEDERYILSCFYENQQCNEDGISVASEHFHIERSSVYKKKDRALAHLTLLLYGK